jgi:hypothetical protein
MQECRNAGMQECRNAEIIKDIYSNIFVKVNN